MLRVDRLIPYAAILVARSVHSVRHSKDQATICAACPPSNLHKIGSSSQRFDRETFLQRCRNTTQDIPARRAAQFIVQRCSSPNNNGFRSNNWAGCAFDGLSDGRPGYSAFTFPERYQDLIHHSVKVHPGTCIFPNSLSTSGTDLTFELRSLGRRGPCLHSPRFVAHPLHSSCHTSRSFQLSHWSRSLPCYLLHVPPKDFLIHATVTQCALSSSNFWPSHNEAESLQTSGVTTG